MAAPDDHLADGAARNVVALAIDDAHLAVRRRASGGCEAFALTVIRGRAWLEAMLDVGTTDPALRASASARAARPAWRQRDYDRARQLLEDSLDLERSLGNRLAVARRLRGLALVDMTEGNAAAAIERCEQSAAAFDAAGDQPALVWTLIFLGLARWIGGDLPGGNEAIRQALALNERVGSKTATAYGRLYLSYAAGRTGDVAAQRDHLTAALTAIGDVGEPLGEPDWLWASASLAASEGRHRAALRLAAGATALSERSGSHLNEQFLHPLEPQIEHARGAVGAALAGRLADQGARMPIEELVAEALAERGDDDEPPLSPREREVVALVGAGLANGDIAAELFISKRTVESHVESIKRKLRCDGRGALIAWAIREREVPGSPDTAA